VIGPTGRDGKDGRPGRDGVDGRPGKDGLDGRPGKDGRDGTVPTTLVSQVNDLMTNALRRDRQYGVQSSKGGFLSDQGRGEFKGMPRPAAWETMRFVQV
jgi:hypothetical protein